MAGLTLRGSNTAAPLAELPIPPEYLLVDPATMAATPRAVNVANAYAHIRADLAERTQHAPTFADAVVTHRMLDDIVTSARRS
jgi:hypothetical protein